MEFENACSEMYYILEHMDPIDRNKIPESTINFFKNHKSIFYKVNLDVTKDLSEQELKDETKAFIQILKAKYFSNGIEENLYKNLPNIEEKEEKKTTELITIKKENKILLWLKKLFGKK